MRPGSLPEPIFLATDMPAKHAYMAMILNGICCLCVRHGCSVTQVGGAGEREQTMFEVLRNRRFSWKRLVRLRAEQQPLVRPDAAQQHALVEVEGIGMERDTRSRSQ